MSYAQKPKKNNRDRTIQVEDYAPLVKRIAFHMMARMPASVQVDDLIQSGMIGLIEASQKFDETRGASFETYAGIRIRGAIVDEMRRGDWAPRSVHRNARRVAEAITVVEKRSGRDAKDHEVAKELDMELSEYYDILQDCASTRVFSLNESPDEGESKFDQPETSIALMGPSEKTQDESMKQALAKAIENLPERERLVLSLYYEQDLNLKEIGQVLGVTESRVSQIHSQATARLRSRLSDWRLG